MEKTSCIAHMAFDKAHYITSQHTGIYQLTGREGVLLLLITSSLLRHNIIASQNENERTEGGYLCQNILIKNVQDILTLQS